MRKFFTLALSAAMLMTIGTTFAQRERVHNYVTIQISPDRADWSYKTGEKVKFDISVIKDTYPQKNVDVECEWGMDMLEPIEKGTFNTGSGTKTITLPGSSRPGFMTLKCTVNLDGTKYTNYTTVGFDPFAIKPTTHLPTDFHEFWKGVLEKSSKVPLEPLMTLMPDRCTPFADVYHVRFQNEVPGRYIYGVISIPKGDGPFPAVLQVPGAGVRAYRGQTQWAPHGVIHLEIGIHGIPVNLPDQIYADLRANALRNYNTSHIDDRDKYYYKNVYSGCVKALDFLCSLPQVDQQRLGVCGGSQGGALSIVVASLDNRIKALYSDYPAMSEIAGFYHGRTGGWPKIFRDPTETNIETKVRVSEYYDVLNFARFVKVPIMFGAGFNDQVCPPTSTFAVYNIMPGPKQMLLSRDSGHWRYPEHRDQEMMWLIEELKK